jgi:hypothetical protein
MALNALIPASALGRLLLSSEIDETAFCSCCKVDAVMIALMPLLPSWNQGIASCPGCRCGTRSARTTVPSKDRYIVPPESAGSLGSK